MGQQKPVQGVTVSISGKGQDKKEFVTDATGNFKVPQMPAGELIIILEKKGYKTYRKEGVTLKEGVPLKLNFDISNEGADDESDVFHPLRMMDSE
ncbi:carboxypeptidase-like regulatory domain-containing protein [Paraflavitalea speifideaquila]|uniref:carboxypeptidase-like regulatory domain-containing protein n=1 Tax=Paraflavitalea speifideaquila TaxID=3076558 RepID=UPI0028EF939D|nr:carboxypeptidase-like regulatory domain-containing protein [Paraflavitalea speifideiaquila]